MNNVNLADFTPEQMDRLHDSAAFTQLNNINPAWAQKAQEVSKQYNIPLYKIVETIKRESNFNSNAHSPNSSATGLGQFIKGTANFLHIDPTDPMQSIEGVGKYLNYLHSQGVPDNFTDERIAYINGPNGYKHLTAQSNNNGQISQLDTDFPIHNPNIQTSPLSALNAETDYDPDNSVAHQFMENLKPKL
jgi:hypothetical protein